jgi:group I intron endonuclease
MENMMIPFLAPKENIHVIYKIYNNQTHKFYIGQSVDYKTRWRAHRNTAAYTEDESNMIIYKSIRKWGIENFDFKIIDYCFSYEEANKLESHYIAKHETYDIEKGYNMRLGGDSSPKIERRIKPELEAKILNAYLDFSIPIPKILEMFNIHTSTLYRVVHRNDAPSRPNTGWKDRGLTHSDETKNKMSNTRTEYWEQWRLENAKILTSEQINMIKNQYLLGKKAEDIAPMLNTITAKITKIIKQNKQNKQNWDKK